MNAGATPMRYRMPNGKLHVQGWQSLIAIDSRTLIPGRIFPTRDEAMAAAREHIARLSVPDIPEWHP